MLPHFRGYFDIVFIDADKDEYPAYLEHAMRLTHVGSIMLDNLFWDGSVINGKRREGKVRGHQGIYKYDLQGGPTEELDHPAWGRLKQVTEPRKLH